jgi:ferredoxin
MELCNDLGDLDQGALPVVTTELTLVLICSDVAKGRPGRRMVDALRDGPMDARVTVVHNLCAVSTKVRSVVTESGANRVVVVCRNGSEVRGEIRALLGRTGLRPSGVVVLDMTPVTESDLDRALAMAVARIRAAITRASGGDLTGPVHERRIRSAARFSRRGLLHPGDIERDPIASWLEDLCNRGGACHACVYSCSNGALSHVGNQIVVEEDLCTGCGACVSACRSGAMSLGGVPIEALEAEANVLIEKSRGLIPRPGVALVCAKSSVTMHLGGAWLPLEVASIEMVSVGWPLQILAAGVPVRLVGCDDDGCVARAREIMKLCNSLVDAAAPELGRPPANSLNDDPPDFGQALVRPISHARDSEIVVQFREPKATISALSTLGVSDVFSIERDSPVPGLAQSPVSKLRRPWSIESSLLPLGEVIVDESRCSACGRCAVVCPSGALAVGDSPNAAFALTLDSDACSACGVCVSSCPESAITLRHVVNAVRLTSRHRVEVKIVNQLKCVVCGSALAGGLATSVISDRLVASHPQLASRLRTEVKCADCMLVQ